MKTSCIHFDPSMKWCHFVSCVMQYWLISKLKIKSAGIQHFACKSVWVMQILQQGASIPLLSNYSSAAEFFFGACMTGIICWTLWIKMAKWQQLWFHWFHPLQRLPNSKSISVCNQQWMTRAWSTPMHVSKRWEGLGGTLNTLVNNRHDMYNDQSSNLSSQSAGVRPNQSGVKVIEMGAEDEMQRKTKGEEEPLELRILFFDLSKLPPWAQFLICCGGVFFFYLIYGYFQVSCHFTAFVLLHWLLVCPCPLFLCFFFFLFFNSYMLHVPSCANNLS